MSLRYKGAVISATPPTTTGGNSGTAPGAWTLQQQLQAQAAGNWPPQPIWYVEDVFSTYLYTGNGSTQTITNGIDLAGKGGLTWIKSRTNTSGGATAHALVDTARGSSKWLSTDAVGAQATNANLVTGFTSAGFSVGNAPYWANENGIPYASWTFRKQPKFFDVVAWTGPSSAVSHSLGAVPGFVIIKSTSRSGNWICIARKSNGNYALFTSNAGLNLTSAANQPDNANVLSSGALTSTTFDPSWFNTSSVAGNVDNINQSGVTYVAYLFAHNAGGFGLTGTDNVISCGSFTTDGSGNMSAPVNLGYEPQWLLLKTSSVADNWMIVDTMRGWSVTGNSNVQELYPNLSNAEGTNSNIIPTATGFTTVTAALAASQTYIYIAIRRGPMKTPTTGTSVFVPATYTGDGTTSRTWSPGITMDMNLTADLANPDGYGGTKAILSRLTGTGFLSTFTTNPQDNNPSLSFNANGTFTYGSLGNDPYGNRYFNSTYDSSYENYTFSRAPGFFDVVCYTGTGSATTQAHNLGVAPELMIVKRRDTAGTWIVYSAATGATNYLILNTPNSAAPATSAWNDTAPTSSVFTVGTSSNVNASGGTFVSYLFASCPGVSKVGSYTGTGATQTISCGFAARFVLIKRTDGSANWWVWDTARGMVAGTDPRIALNDTPAQANNNWVYTNASGFQIVTTDATVNASGGSYIYLAIA